MVSLSFSQSLPPPPPPDVFVSRYMSLTWRQAAKKARAREKLLHKVLSLTQEGRYADVFGLHEVP